jgi:hypothetical protein
LSARHTVIAFSRAIQGFTRNPHRVVDLFSCSSPFVVPPVITDHLRDFLAVVVGLDRSPKAVFEFIASALLVQAYRPQSHCWCFA